MNTAGKLTIAAAALSIFSCACAETNTTTVRQKPKTAIPPAIKKLDYLEKLFNGITDEDTTAEDNTQGDEKIKTIITLKNGEKIKTDKQMSLVLLSFEREEQLRKQRLAEIKRKREEERKRAERQKTRGFPFVPPPTAGTGKRFPTLQEQMAAFQNGGALPDLANGEGVSNGMISPSSGMMPPMAKSASSAYFGTICRGKKCYLLGEHKLYKRGDIVGGKKIVKITADYVVFDKGKKEWFTR